MKKIFIILVIFLQTNLHANNNERILYEAYIHENMESWRNILQQYETKVLNYKEVYEETEALYGYIGYLLGIKEKKEARIYLKRANLNIEKLLYNKPNSAQLHSLKAALLGFEIALYPLRTPIIGPKSIEHLEIAKKNDPNNALLWIVSASRYYYMPSILGGSKERGLNEYHKAISLFEKHNQEKQNWQYLNSLAILGSWYAEQKQNHKARKLYNKALETEPNFKWVKEKLLPALDKN